MTELRDLYDINSNKTNKTHEKRKETIFTYESTQI